MYLSNEIKSAPMLCADFRKKGLFTQRITNAGGAQCALHMDRVHMDMSRAHGLVAKEARVVLGFDCISCFLRPNVGFRMHLREKKSSE